MDAVTDKETVPLHADVLLHFVHSDILSCSLTSHGFFVYLRIINDSINSRSPLSLSLSACEAFADTMYNTIWTLGCRPFMNSQRAACICEGEEKDEL